MATRVESFVARLGRFNTFFTPAALQRLQRRWLLERPLAWRSNVLWVAWWSAWAAVLAGAAGFTRARYGTEVWTAADLRVAAVLGAVLSGSCISTWVLLVLRHAVGELPWGRQLRLTALHALGVLMLILPGDVFTLAVTRGIAGRVPSAVFAADDALCKEFELGCCDPSAVHDPTMAGRIASGHDSEALRAALRRYASTDESLLCSGGRTEPCWQRRQAGADAVNPPVDAISYRPQLSQALVEYLSSMGSSQDLWEHGKGEYVQRYVACIGWELGLALAFGLLLSFVSYPASGRRRSVWWPSLPRWGSYLPRAWRPRLLARAEHRLLVSHPQLWATRFPVLWILWGLAAVLLAVALAPTESSDYWLIAVIAAAILFPISWGLIRRADVMSPDFRASTRLVHAGCLALLPSLVIWIWIELFGEFGANPISRGLFYAAAFSTTSLAICLLRSFRGRISAAFACCWCAAFWLFTIDSQVFAWVIFIPVVLAALLVQRIPSPIPQIIQRVAGGLLCSTPIVFIAARTTIGIIQANLQGASVARVAVLALLFVGAFLLYVFTTLRALGVLLRAYYQPRSG